MKTISDYQFFSCKDEPCKPYFSWAACEAELSKECQLGGSRYDIVALHREMKEKAEFSVCEDCHQKLLG